MEKQRPCTASANYLAESSPRSRIRVVPAVGLNRRMALGAGGGKKISRKAFTTSILAYDETGTYSMSACRKHMDLETARALDV